MERRSQNLSARPLVVTSTPTARPSRAAPVHPSMQHLGRRGGKGYVLRQRNRRRRALTRRSAAVILGMGVVLSGPVLAVSGGPDAAARQVSTTPHPGPKPAAAREAQPAIDAGFQAPKPVDSEIFPPTSTTASVRLFDGFAVTRRGQMRWIGYPAARSHPFLVCTRSFESDTAGGYRAVSPDGRHRGAYQFKRSTWNQVARHVGRRELVGVDPAAASRRDQDWMALYLYRWQGASHWEGRCAGK